MFWTVAGTTASAQGPPPFALPGDASRSTQVVRMQLGLRDPDGVAPSETVLEARSPFQQTLSRTQENRAAATGILSMFPLGTLVSLLPVAGGSVIQLQPSDSGSR